MVEDKMKMKKKQAKKQAKKIMQDVKKTLGQDPNLNHLAGMIDKEDEDVLANIFKNATYV